MIPLNWVLALPTNYQIWHSVTNSGHNHENKKTIATEEMFCTYWKVEVNFISICLTCVNSKWVFINEPMCCMICQYIYENFLFKELPLIIILLIDNGNLPLLWTCHVNRIVSFCDIYEKIFPFYTLFNSSQDSWWSWFRIFLATTSAVDCIFKVK